MDSARSICYTVPMRSAFLAVALLASTTSCSVDGAFFRWDRPHFAFGHLPIRDSATCRFKQSMLARMDKGSSDNHQQVEYYKGKEDEADTVAFADLDTDTPKIVANNGQGPLQLLYRHDRAIGLINPLSYHSEIEIFTIFLDSGVILHSVQHEMLGTPSGVMEMGFCN